MNNPRDIKGRFIKGNKSWNERSNKNNICKKCKISFFAISSSRKFCSRPCYYKWKSLNIRGEKHHLWKGENIKRDIGGLKNLHVWINENFEKINECENCGNNKNLDWANISGKYLRDRSDWIRLCRKCHMDGDGRNDALREYASIGNTPWNKGEGREKRICKCGKNKSPYADLCWNCYSEIRTGGRNA